MLTDLRLIYRAYPAQEIRNLTIEIEHYRRLVKELDGCYEVVQQAWNDLHGGHLIGLYFMQQALYRECERLRSGGPSTF